MSQVAPTNTLVAVVPTKHTESVVLSNTSDKSREFDTYQAVVDYFNATFTRDAITIVAPMGGPGQSLIMRLKVEGYSVYRIPWFKLEDTVDLVADSSTPAAMRCRALIAAFVLKSENFYEMIEIDRDIALLREAARVRGTVQRYFRIRAQQIYGAAERDLMAMLPELDMYKKLRTTFANPRMIEAAKADEKDLEKLILKLLQDIPIYDLLRDHETLPKVAGFGPAIAGSIIGEIGDIRRFPDPGHLRSYARYDVRGGAMRRPVTGQVSSWNRYLSQAVWLFSSDQAVKQAGVWQDLYYLFKSDYQRKHAGPEEVVVAGKTRYRYTLGHLNRMAQRKVGSHLLEYIWYAWTNLIERPGDVTWFFTPRTVYIEDEGAREFKSFASLFEDATTYAEINKAYCKAEAVKRGKKEPKLDVPDIDAEEVEEVFNTEDPSDDLLE